MKYQKYYSRIEAEVILDNIFSISHIDLARLVYQLYADFPRAQMDSEIIKEVREFTENEGEHDIKKIIWMLTRYPGKDPLVKTILQNEMFRQYFDETWSRIPRVRGDKKIRDGIIAEVKPTEFQSRRITYGYVREHQVIPTALYLISKRKRALYNLSKKAVGYERLLASVFEDLGRFESMNKS